MSPEDTDSVIDLEHLVAAARRQARIVALGAALGLALGGAYLAFTPRVYTASTNILLDDSLTKFAEDKDAPPAHIQADSMILSEVEILKSTRLARAVVIAEKLNENEAFLNPPGSPIDWLKDQVRAVTPHLCLGAAQQGRGHRGSQHHAGGGAPARRPYRRPGRPQFRHRGVAQRL